MNAKRTFCKTCEGPMSKIIAHTGKGDLALGSYCPRCKKIFNLEGVPLIPRSLLPGREEVKKALGGFEPVVLPSCSIKESEDSKLDHDTFKKDLQKEAENIFKKYPKKV